MLRYFLTVLSASFLLAYPSLAGAQTKTGPDGLHIQSWFYESSGDARLDLLAAAAKGKNLIVLYEQVGCYYCVMLHEKNFSNPEIVKLITDNFLVVQMDLWSDGAIIDFDGAKLTESSLARKWGVTTTPTTLVFNAANPSVTAFKQAEVFRLPGYLESFEYFSVLDYFASGAFESQGLSAFIATKSAEFAQAGIDPKSW